MLEQGQRAPLFTLLDQNGQSVSLSDLLGKWVLFWWYPEAGSQGCSLQAASLARHRADFDHVQTAIVGASFNSIAQNDKFSCDYELGYPILSDSDRAIGAAYGVVRPMGEKYDDKPFRMTFIIDPMGTIAFSERVPAEVLNDYAARALKQLREAQNAG